MILHRDRLGQDGGPTASAWRNPLGAPDVDLLSLLVREAVQNSWDARIHGQGPAEVQFSAGLSTFNAAQMGVLRDTVFAQLPQSHGLAASLNSGRLQRLVLADRGTVGLGGPVVMTPRSGVGGDRRFIRFFKLLGREDHEGSAVGGGTYGYGKAALFRVSRPSVIIVHTRCRDGGGFPEERLIAMGIQEVPGDDMETGRLWWGDPDPLRPGCAVPVAGEVAAQLAAQIGFHPFDPGETGTSIMILDPSFGATLDEAGQMLTGECIAESLVIWFWPRMIGAADGDGKLCFSVDVGGRPIPIPDPCKEAPLKGFVAALEAVRTRMAGDDVQPPDEALPIVVSSPGPRRTGWLGLGWTPFEERLRWKVEVLEGHPFADLVRSDPVCHVALMRTPGQVVRYMECEPLPDRRYEYGGILLAWGDDPATDVAFARSEPPSHDDWRPEAMKDDDERRIVRRSLSAAKSMVSTWISRRSPQTAALSGDMLSDLSQFLGRELLIPGRTVHRHGRKAGIATRGQKTRAAPVDSSICMEVLDGRRVCVVTCVVGPEQRGHLWVHAAVLVSGGGAETSAPDGAPMPRLAGWRDPQGTWIPGEEPLRIDRGMAGEWKAVITLPDDVMVRIATGLHVGLT